MKQDERPQRGVDRPAANHEDALSPARSVREQATEGGGHRVGNATPVDGPEVSPLYADDTPDGMDIEKRQT